MNEALLEIEDLVVRYPGRGGEIVAVRGASFAMGREKLGIVGESGSGKSTVGRAILRLVAPPGTVSARRMSFDGTDLLGAPERRMRGLRGGRISMILQDPKFSLNPVIRVGEQIAEVVRLHQRKGRGEARRCAMGMLEAVRIREPERVMRAYPHELSGGMGQRVMIAIMLACEPDLLIADEPTSALDVTVQMQVLSILDDLVSSRGMGLLFISHDLELVATFCDRILVMYAGRIVETIEAARLHEARHPYTQGLLGCLPRIDRPRRHLPVLDRDPAWERP